MADDFIYLDYNATTPIDPRVADAMRPFLTGGWGNPSSAHRAGREARAAVDRGREQVAALLGAQPSEVVFTSGGSESNNLAIRGVLGAGDHVITSSVEHPAVLEVVRALEAGGVRLTVIPVDSDGRVDPKEVVAHLREETRLVTIMLANNEVGTLQPIREISAACRARGVLVHTDAAQAVGKIPVDVAELGIDLLTVAGHKLYAPKGVGALYVAAGVGVTPLIRGANHERGLRAGTENVLEIVGLGEACALARAELGAEVPRLRGLRDRLTAYLRAGPHEIHVHAEGADRLPNTASLALVGVDANKLLELLSESVAASAGAACHSEGVQSSHVLAAMGVSPAIAASTLRLSVGRFTTDEEIQRAVLLILEAARD